MITYWPIILESTVSKGAIWLETKDSFRMPNEEYIDLYINYGSHTFELVKFNSEFDSHAGTNEGSENVIFRAPVLRAQLENMASEIIAEIGETQSQAAVLNLKYKFVQNELNKLIFLIQRSEDQPNLSFQVSYVKEEFRSIFQIQTSAERIHAFMAMLIEKIAQTQ
jgi:hypothetical protein